MELSEARRKSESLMREHGLTGWRFKFDNAARRAGQTNYTNRIISLSRHITELNPWSAVRGTVLHEIAHALVGYEAGHNKAWKAKAAEIGAPTARTHRQNVPEPKWWAYCKCRDVWKRHRRPRAGSYCPRCKVVLKWVPAPPD